MKILITTDWYKPVINGVVTSVINLKSGLEKMGHEVRILTLSNSIHSYEEDGVTYIGSINAGIIYPNARLKMAFSHDYIKELIKWKPDVIHSQCEFSTFLLAKRISSKTQAPIIHTYHTVYEDYTHYFSPNKRLGKAVVAALSRRILKKTASVIAPTDKVKNMLEGYNINPPVFTIPSGLDLSKFDNRLTSIERNAFREKLGISKDSIVMIYLGRLAKEKNVEEIIGYLKDEPDKNVKLLIVGDGPYRENLVNYSDDSRIIFTGMVSPDEVVKYYQLGDIFVSASQSETQGLTYIEAMASKLPILCRNDECLKDVVIQNKTGYVYNNEQEFKEILNKLKEDRSLRESIGLSAEEYVNKKFSSSAFAKNVYKVYSLALENETYVRLIHPVSLVR